MEAIRSGFGLGDLRALVARRRWLFLIPFLGISLLATGFALMLPDIYRAETVILVDPAKIPERYVAPIATIDVKDRLQTLSQQVMSRTRLEQVIRSLGLWPQEWNDPRAMERRVSALRRRIDVQVTGKDSFVIGFEGEDPVLVQKITNGLAALFIEENSRVRAERASGTAEFIEAELREIERRLAAKEEEIRAYREAHLGELPEQKEANLRALDALRLRLTANEEATQRLVERRAMVQRQLALLGQAPDASPLRAELLKLYGSLRELEAQFTDRHPDVRMTRQRIAEIERQLKGAPRSTPALPDGLALDPVVAGLQRELEQIALDLSSRATERRNLERQVQELEARVAAAPRREQEYAALTRDYQNLKDTYQRLLDKRIQAGMAEELERRQAGATFTVLDPAEVPKRPVKPKRGRIVLLGLVVGLAAGLGCAYLGEAIDQSIRSVEDFKRHYDLPVLGAIPDLALDDAALRRKARRAYLERVVHAARLGI
ncbi:MAG TPA: XrtA system polysaccharide chain length determinant [Thermodesulfobacteriota bacterium]|nr:XrtA system polysaccharide chain length determinant [Thermodesulfobacteriota bacterium]